MNTIDLEGLGVVLRLGLGGLIIFCIVRLLLLQLLRERFQTRLIEIRQSLRRLAIDPQEPAYQQLAGTINGLLREPHRATLSHYLLTKSAHLASGREYIEREATSLRQIRSADTRRAIVCHREDVGNAIVDYIRSASPLGWVLWVGGTLRRFVVPSYAGSLLGRPVSLIEEDAESLWPASRHSEMRYVRSALDDGGTDHSAERSSIAP